MSTAIKNSRREKVNFMLDKDLVETIRRLIPEGERSDFANLAFEEALMDFKRRKAYEEIKKLRAKNKVYVSTKAILKARNADRK